MTPGLYHIAASLLGDGLQPTWIKSLKAAPQDSRASGLRPGGVRILRIYGVIERVPPERNNLPAKWAEGAAYPAFVKMVEAVQDRQAEASRR